MTDTEKRIAEIKFRLSKSTRGDWNGFCDGDVCTIGIGDLGPLFRSEEYPNAPSDMHLLASAPSDIAWLLEQNQQLRKELEWLKPEPVRMREPDMSYAYEEKIEELRLTAERYIKVLRNLRDHFWFDAIKEKGIACHCCDLGEAGLKMTLDGHDVGCPVSEARAALAEGDER